MKPIILADNFNYIAVFLTLACNLECNYCINRIGEFGYEKGHLTGEEWVCGLNRIVSRTDLPVTLGGGEPSLHPEFFDIINGVRQELNIDLLTNLQCDLKLFAQHVPPARLKRNAPYASIRVSYHPKVMALAPLAERVLTLQELGYSIGIWGVLHPEQEQEIMQAREYCLALGIDFRCKEFLGTFDEKMYGSIKYPGACNRQEIKRVQCRSNELIIGPTGNIYRCHGDLYEGRKPIGHILDPDFEIVDRFRTCHLFGRCNPCDVKVKTNRFQVAGHTSVEIIFPGDEGTI